MSRGAAPFEVFKRAIKEFLSDNMPTYAGTFDFRALLTLLVTIGSSAFFDWLLSQNRTALPAVAFGIVERIIGEIRGQQRGGLLSFSILLAICAAYDVGGS